MGIKRHGETRRPPRKMALNARGTGGLGLNKRVKQSDANGRRRRQANELRGDQSDKIIKYQESGVLNRNEFLDRFYFGADAGRAATIMA